MLLKDSNIDCFFKSNEFDEMLLRVGKDDVIGFKSNNKWLENHPSNAVIFSETKNIWQEIKSSYLTNFKSLVFGEFPDEKEILETLSKISSRLQGLKWGIKTKTADNQQGA